MAHMKGNMTFKKGNMALIKGNMALTKGNMALHGAEFSDVVYRPEKNSNLQLGSSINA